MRKSLIHYFIFALLVTMTSCGGKINTKSKSVISEAEISYLLIEKSCTNSMVNPEPVTVEINKQYNDFLSKNPFAFFNMPVRNYDYKTPMIVNLDDLAEGLKKFTTNSNNAKYGATNLNALSEQIFYLYQNSMRFEGQKCSFPYLTTKKYSDIRPYMMLKDFCVEKNNNEICSSETLVNLSSEESSFIEENTIKLCKAFDSSDVNCQAQYNLQRKNKTTPSLVALYQKRFQEERFEKMFLLRDSHLSFKCSKDETVTTMTVKVYSQSLDIYTLGVLTRYVSDTWSRNNFKLSIEIVDSPGSDVVEIKSTNNPVSHVPDNNNLMVFLSNKLDPLTSQRVLAHEFGHVLGFPDCYIEFFDNQKKDLVYYEQSQENTNIMCSLKAGVSVPDDYLAQLSQNSCVF